MKLQFTVIKLFTKKPEKVNGINLVYTPSVNSKNIFTVIQFFHLFMFVFQKLMLF